MESPFLGSLEVFNTFFGKLFLFIFSGVFSSFRVNAGHSVICKGQMAETNGLR